MNTYETKNELVKISFVIAARNDDYGDNFLNRMETFLRILISLTNKYKSNFELVIVEYNPPKDHELLSQALKIKDNHYLPVRFISVPMEFHKNVSHGFKNPLFEFLGKNIGIRRARGEYILTMNPDIIFSDELIKFLTQNPLDKGNFYRVDRHDVSVRTFDENMKISDIYTECEKKTTRVWNTHGLIYVSFIRWLKRFLRSPKPHNFILCPLFNFRYKIKNIMHPNALHLAAAGDFCLAHRDAWSDVGGFYQEPFNLYLDSYNVCMFYCKGYAQQVLRFPIFHMNHDWGNNIRSSKSFLEHASEGYDPKNGKSTITTPEEFEQNVREMMRTKIPFKENVPDWGFPEAVFEERTIAAQTTTTNDQFQK